MSKKVSLIIPAYNAENSISRAIDSVLNQKYIHEIIVVNDGSKDSTLSILNEYSKLHNKLRVIDQKNSGASHARNVGLDEATGDYISFLDSDDYLIEDTIQKNLDELVETKSDIIMYSYNRVEMTNDKFKIIQHVNKDTVIDLNADCLFLETLIQNVSFNHLWNKIYKREIIEKNKIRFDRKIILGEDYIFNIAYIESSTRLLLSSRISYNYVETKGGLTKKFYCNKFKELSYAREATLSVIKKYQLDESIYYNTVIRNLTSYLININHKNSSYSMKNKYIIIKSTLNLLEVQKAIENLGLKKSKYKVIYIILKLRLKLLLLLFFYIISKFRR